jgi:peptidoglycan hydrolase-like protein with peptidoglycan-binding domain
LTVRTRVWLISVLSIVVVLAALAGVALLAWPSARLGSSDDALAHVVLPGFAGRVAAVDVRSASGAPVPVQLRQGKLWPRHRLAAGERLTVELTVRRPGWAGWLVGHTARRSFTIETPRVHLLGRWLQVKPGAPVTVAFDAPVALVSLGGSPARTLPAPQAVVPVGVVARGSLSAGAIEVAAAARSWESLPAPVRVSWFPSRPYPQLLAEPKPGATLAPAGRLTLTFSNSIGDVLGAGRPRLSPAAPGHWRQLDAHTLAFQPSGFGFGLGVNVRVELPVAVHLAGQAGARLTRTLHWQVPQGSTLRLQQLLAKLGYLPLQWQPTADHVAATASAQLAAAVSPPSGRFSWRYPNTPGELRALWGVGRPNDITRGAVMMFEDTHGLTVDGLVGPRVWRALIEDDIAGQRLKTGYNYVFIHRSLPQSLNLWHNGHVILSSPGNTGVPSAPTQLGTYPVFEHLAVGTMSGTNPDGSHYNDPGIRYISYFHGGDAIHAFNRASFGTPQSLGCVELPLAAAAKVWPYTPIGTLVTIEN